MKTVTVHHFQHYDVMDDVLKSPPSKRTAKSIKALGCEIIQGTSEKVDPDLLDEEGRYYPPGLSRSNEDKSWLSDNSNMMRMARNTRVLLK